MKYHQIILLLTLSLSTQAQLSYYDKDPLFEGADGNNVFQKYSISYDLNNDNISDILHLQNNRVYVLYGDGSSFGNEELVHEHTSLLFDFSNTADINGDGRLDFVITGANGQFLVFTGTSNGVEHVAMNGSADIARIVDLDSDGDNDIVYTTGSELFYLAGNNDGSFDQEISITGGLGSIQSVFRFTVEDIDGDNDNDFYVFDVGTNSVVAILNNNQEFELSHSVPANGIVFGSGDFDLDGLLDLVVINSDDDIEIHLYKADGFQNSHTYSTTSVIDIITYDYNADGRDDLLLSEKATSLSLLTSNGDGTLSDANEIITEIPKISRHSFADFNDDGIEDIVAISAVAYNQVILIPLTPQVQASDKFDYISLRQDPGTNNGTQIGDLDKDGFEDLVIFSENGAVYVYYGIDGGFDSDYVQYTSNVHTNSGFLHDLDGDGYLDMVIEYRSSSNGQIGTEQLFNQTSREFSSPQDFKYVFGIIDGLLDDYDKDGTSNFIVSTSQGEIVFLTADVNNFDEYFTGDPLIISTTDFVEDFTLVDINGDNYKDLLVAVANSSSIEVHINDQMGGFDVPSTIDLPSEAFPTAVQAADLDDDAIMEIIVATDKSGTEFKGHIFSRQSNMDDFELGDSFDIGSFYGSEYIYVQDFNGDSSPDILFNDFDNSNYSFALNLDDGWNIESDVLESFSQNNLNLVDINADDLPDLVRVRLSSGSIQISENNTVFEPSDSNTELISAERVNATSIEITLSEAQHDGRIVLLKEGNATDASPQDGIFYAQNTTLGVGAELGEGNFVVYSGEGSEFTIEGLETLTNYQMSVFEYNVNVPNNDIINYYTTSFLTTGILIKANQTLTNENQGDIDFEVGTFAINITSSSGLPVALELVSGPITLEENTATILDYGTVVIKASQAGNDEYLPAEETFEFEITDVLSVADNPISIYPNPASSYLKINNLNSKDVTSIQIVDLAGKIHPISNSSNEVIDIRNLRPGVYFVRINSENQVQSFRLIKN